MPKRAWWAGSGGRAAGRHLGGGMTAKPVIVTRELQLIEKATILTACQAKGVATEKEVIPRGKAIPEVRKVPLVKLAEWVGIEGEYFRSKKEGLRYIELRRFERYEGTIRNLRRSPRWELHTTNPDGLKVVISEYTADFEYDEQIDARMVAATLFGQDAGWHHIFEESKGFPTPDYELRKKWVEAEYGITIRTT